MKQNILILSFIILVLVAVIVVTRFGLSGQEDNWLCQDGTWVKHGNPKNPAPISGCGVEKTVTNFEECAALGQPIVESYPRQCQFNGQNFVEDIGNGLAKADLIRVDNPLPNQKINNPVIISGVARGYWFFEASFPVNVYDDNSNLLGTGIAQAQSDWMTTDFVPFSLTLQFSQPQTAKGVLILRKDNPSGLPENEDQLEIPIFFQ
ncbi:MAG: Gmad2 immunoglobulin-like domain-containing protein [Candidatus Buchananbacteria bacterium]|nr:Gmad2 immunoglobulin-like domain-containing protein [Candidatus Buchananbacteria bacterium]